MEDRYLFKAKTCNGEWVSGFLHCKENKWYISNKAGAPFAFEVRPDAICQCTGMTDKSGNLIWENDIVKFDIYREEKLVSNTVSQVKWCDDLCALSLIVNNRGTRGTLGHIMDLNKEIEVIGNKFDNPELLERRFMNTEKAISILRHLKNLSRTRDFEEEALDMAIKALEKQIPKKKDSYSCPVCSNYFEDGEDFKYCHECGQRWG